ncbi:hypothetical protein F5141DRAFT_1065853 [Pisolithus sp. B1]|nr:hypothetical protein F5141DRAFT_1065853 [Pisolithus sp. B1]
MFVKNSPALQDAVDCILTIFEMLIINSGGLDEAEKLEQWRNAVRDIWQELESVRSIANRTDNVPHMLIGMDKYIHWMENIGMPGIPFLDWCQALFPPIESIANHPWLLTIKWFDIICHAYKTSIDLKPVYGASHGSQGVSRPYTNVKHSIRDESKDIEEDIEMDDIEPNTLVMITNDPKGQESPAATLLKYGHAQLVDCMTPPPNTQSCQMCINCKVIYTCTSGSGDQMIGHIDEGEQQIMHVMCQIMVPTPVTVEDHMQMLENKLAECRYTIAMLMCKLEAIRVNLQHPQQVQDNSMQTPQADTGMTMTTLHVVEPQDENVGSPHSKSETREVMPTHGEPPAIDQGVELLVTESSDNGGQGGQGEEANIVEGTAVAGEA